MPCFGLVKIGASAEMQVLQALEKFLHRGRRINLLFSMYGLQGERERWSG
jgi:hypothetical protein